MTRSERNPKVDRFIREAGQWQEEFKKLREILLSSLLTEELKWGVPCYSLEGKNVVLMHGFKEYCALLFVKGALLKDPAGILIQQTENVQSARQIRFRNVGEIEKLEPTLKAYIDNAIEVEKAGLKVDFKKPAEFAVRLGEAGRRKVEASFDSGIGLKKPVSALLTASSACVAISKRKTFETPV